MNSPRKPTRSRPETIAKRREILKAATDVFGSKGYANGTLADIAELVDMTHAGILHHFGSKDALLLEVLTYRDETDVEHLIERHIPGGIELFRHLVRTAFRNAERGGIVQAFAVLSGESVTDDHPAREYFIRRYGSLRQEIVEAFEEVCAEQGVAETDPAAMRRASAGILAVMDGLQVQWLLQPDAVELGEATMFAIDALASAVLDPRPSRLGISAEDAVAALQEH